MDVPLNLDSMVGLDGKPDHSIETAVKLGRFEDIFGTEHEIRCILGKGRSTCNCQYRARLIKKDGTKALIKLQEPTTNGVQEVWVESSRLS